MIHKPFSNGIRASFLDVRPSIESFGNLRVANVSETCGGTARLIHRPFLVICQLPRSEQAFDDEAESFKVSDAEALREHV